MFNKDFVTNENFIYNEFQKYNFQDKEIIILNDIDNLSNQSVVDLQKFLLNNGFIVVFLNPSFGNNKDLIYSLDYPDIKAVRGSSRNQFFTIENIDFVNKDFLANSTFGEFFMILITESMFSTETEIPNKT